MATCQMLQGMQDNECLPEMWEELRGALCFILQSFVGQIEEVSRITQTARHAPGKI
jgi:hypothetical protein